MRNAHCRTWNMASKMKNIENEKCTLQDLEYCEKTEKTWKISKAHLRIWKLSRNTEKHQKCAMHTLGTGIWQEN